MSHRTGWHLNVNSTLHSPYIKLYSLTQRWLLVLKDKDKLSWKTLWPEWRVLILEETRHPANSIPVVKHSGGNIMLCCFCFFNSSRHQEACPDEQITFLRKHKSSQDLWLRQRWLSNGTMTQNNPETLGQVCECPCMGQEVSRHELNLWKDLKIALPWWSSFHMTDLQRFCGKDWINPTVPSL